MSKQHFNVIGGCPNSVVFECKMLTHYSMFTEWLCYFYITQDLNTLLLLNLSTWRCIFVFEREKNTEEWPLHLTFTNVLSFGNMKLNCGQTLLLHNLFLLEGCTLGFTTGFKMVNRPLSHFVSNQAPRDWSGALSVWGVGRLSWCLLAFWPPSAPTSYSLCSVSMNHLPSRLSMYICLSVSLPVRLSLADYFLFISARCTFGHL